MKRFLVLLIGASVLALVAGCGSKEADSSVGTDLGKQGNYSKEEAAAAQPKRGGSGE